MKKETYKKLWMTTQALLFIIPIIVSVIFTGYQISWDAHYVDNVNSRALIEGYSPNKFTDFSDAEVSKADISGTFERKVWKQNNKSVYFILNIVIGVTLGCLLQIFNMIWKDIYEMKYGDKDEGYY